MRIRTRWPLWTGALAATATLVACASSLDDADRLWRDGRVEAAVAAYERTAGVASGHPEETALLRLGLAYAAPSSPVHDPALARARLARLVERFPSGRYREAAEVLLQLVAAFEVADHRAERLKEEHEALAARVSAAEADLAVARTTLARVRGELAEVEETARRLRSMLEQLKRIDLERRP